VRALFLGLGGAGQRHLRNLKRLEPDVKVAAVRVRGRRFEIGDALTADPSSDIVAKYGISELPDLAAGIAWRPDFAVVASPSAVHLAQCGPLVEAGVGVLVEKPLGTDEGELHRFYALAERQRVPVAVGYSLRYHPCVQLLKAWSERGIVGAPQSLEVLVNSHMPSWHGYERPGDFYAGRRALGGGVVLTEIHEIDLLCWLFGPVSRVAAFGGTLGGYDIDVEDTVGIVASLTSGVPVTMSLSFVQRPPMRRFTVNGRDGRVVMDIPRLHIAAEDVSGAAVENVDVPEFDRNTLFVEELRDFLTWIHDGIRSPSLATLESIEPGQAVALAVREALASGAVVDVPYRAP